MKQIIVLRRDWCLCFLIALVGIGWQSRFAVSGLRGHARDLHAVALGRTGTPLDCGSAEPMRRVSDSPPSQVGAREHGYVPPKGYIAFRAATAVDIDGKLDESAWQRAPWTDDFVDIEGDNKPRPRFRTRAKMLWNDQYFYIAAELEEPHLQGTYTEHDSPIFHEDNDFEVFIDPDGDSHNYGEFEMNARNTSWDLHLSKPYKNGGKADNGWEIAGLKTAVHLDGTLNDPRDIDRGWTLEIAIPWNSLGRLIGADPDKHAKRSERVGSLPRPAPPRDGDWWRVNFSRVEWQFSSEQGKYKKVAGRPEDNWVWSPQGTINMHRPESWGYVQFSAAAAGATEAHNVVYRPDPAGPAKHLLHRVLYAQDDFRRQHNRWARSVDELGLSDLTHQSLAQPLALTVAGDHYEATAIVRLADGLTATWHISDDAKIAPMVRSRPVSSVPY